MVAGTVLCLVPPRRATAPVEAEPDAAPALVTGAGR
jgi:hypothetical protein